MTATMMVELCAISLLAGVMIGCIGIGGVILVPALYYLEGIQIHTAIAAAMLAYLVSGAIGTFAFWRRGSVAWHMAAPLWLGAMPAALIGALISEQAPARALEFMIGLLTAGSGLQSLLISTPGAVSADRSLAPLHLAGIGSVTGFASALSGTGGPLVLVPILLWWKLPVLTAIGLAQAIQLPIALLATAGNVVNGTIDLMLGANLAAGLALGTWAGALVAHAAPRARLKQLIGFVLILAGALILYKVGRGNFP